MPMLRLSAEWPAVARRLEEPRNTKSLVVFVWHCMLCKTEIKNISIIKVRDFSVPLLFNLYEYEHKVTRRLGVALHAL